MLHKIKKYVKMKNCIAIAVVIAYLRPPIIIIIIWLSISQPVQQYELYYWENNSQTWVQTIIVCTHDGFC